ncbi:MAG: hypothetical protein RSC87_09355, partial [Muribaculaceae bacterium]
MLKTTESESDFVEMYCRNDLNEEEIDRAKYLITSNISEFIIEHTEGLERINTEHVNLEDIEFKCEYAGNLSIQHLRENTALAKVLFLKELIKESIFIGSSEHEKFIDEGREIQFYPVYTKQSGHVALSEILSCNKNGKTYKYMYFITPNIEIIGEEIYIFPIIGVRRFIQGDKTKEVLEGSKANANTVIVYDGQTYHTPRVRYNKSESYSGVGHVWVDKKLFDYLDEYKGISFQEIKNSLESDEENENILLVYNNKMKYQPVIKSGLPNGDKLDIFNHIIENIPGLVPLKAVNEINTRASGAINSSGKITLNNCIYRNQEKYIHLHVIHNRDNEVDLYEKIIEVVENQLIVEKDNIRKEENGVYYFKIGKSDTEEGIHLMIHDVDGTIALRPKSKDETIEQRTQSLSETICMGQGLNIAVIELEIRDRGTDAKQIVRASLDKLGVINQFVTKADHTKLISGMKDLLNDIGLGNAVQLMGEQEEIYTIRKVNERPMIGRLSNTTIEVILPGMNDFVHITKAYSFLHKVKEIQIDEQEMIDTFIDVLEQSQKRKIVILEDIATQKDVVINTTDSSLMARIKELSDVCVTTRLLDRELVQIDKGSVSYGKGCYKVEDEVYISIGEKGQIQRSVEASKIRSWNNTQDGISIGATIDYKDRVGYEINVNGSESPEQMAKFMHMLRLSTTTHMHLNKTILTDYMMGLAKHMG